MTSGLAEIEDKIKRTKLSKEAREKAQHEFNKLRQHRCRPRPQSCAIISTAIPSVLGVTGPY